MKAKPESQGASLLWINIRLGVTIRQAGRMPSIKGE
jgi:hypothetical protein